MMKANARTLLALAIVALLSAVTNATSFAELERIGEDTTLPAQVRGAALTELAQAHENVFPSLPGLFLETFGDHSHLNRTRAVELYRKAAELGNETAQFRMGTLYATGALGVQRDTAKAVLHYYFASMGGSIPASMALGFRHSLGLGVPKNCKAAVVYYELAANHAVDAIEALGAGFIAERERLSLDKKTRGYAGRSSRGEDEEVVDYYKHSAEKGDLNALVALGQIYFYGARGVQRDHTKALEYFGLAAANGDPLAQANLGHMLVRGMGIEQDITNALSNFSAAAEAGSPAGHNGLGYMYLYGLGVDQDAALARKYFNDAAEVGNAEALYNLGALYVSGVGVRRRNYPNALNYFSMAAQKGHVLAMHKLAQMNLHGIGVAMKNCDHALQLFKAVAERGEYVQLLARGYSFWNNEDDSESALQVYLVASELGFEVAQANAAWLLDHGAQLRGGVLVGGEQAVGSSSSASSTSEEEDMGATDVVTAYLGFVQEMVSEGFPGVTGSQDSLWLYQLAAEQGNVEARLRIGDYYYYGLGGEDPNFELAAHHYKQASDAHNAQALFNLGFMHQHGIGLPRDFHLAKRFYDTAGTTHGEARVPVYLALSGLWLHRIYRGIVHKELSTDLPPFVSILAEWKAFLFGTGDSSEAPVESTSSSATPVAEDSTVQETSLTDVLMELEDDTIVAICLFILLVFVLILRSREQRRIREQQLRNQTFHEHQD